MANTITEAKCHQDNSVSYIGHDGVRVRTFEPLIEDLSEMTQELREQVVHHITNRQLGCLTNVERF